MKKLSVALLTLILTFIMTACSSIKEEQVEAPKIIGTYLLAYIRQNKEVVNYNELELMGRKDDYIEFNEEGIETKTFGETCIDIEINQDEEKLILDNRILDFKIKDDTCIIYDKTNGNNLELIYKEVDSNDWTKIKSQEVSFEQDIQDKLRMELDTKLAQVNEILENKDSDEN